MPGVPSVRVRVVVDRPVSRGGRHVLYWCTGARRASHNFALERAADLAEELGLPLVVLEPLGARHRFASDRLHAFVLEGMATNANAFRGTAARYVPWVERVHDGGRRLLVALARDAACVVADDAHAGPLPRLLESAALALGSLGVRLEAVDGNGLLPLGLGAKAYASAQAFRRHLQATLAPHLERMPSADPLAGRALPQHGGFDAALERRLEAPPAALLAAERSALAELPIDHGVPPSTIWRGGSAEGNAHLARFVHDVLPRYADERQEPAARATSGLSPYLHFGHVGVHQVFAAIAARERWTPARLGTRKDGRREGWWGLSAAAEAFCDQLVTWRELALQHAAARPDTHATYEDQPEFAKRTLAEHARDARPHLYRLDELAAARTHDDVWNAAQRQLLREGVVHGHLRMLWGKLVLTWTSEPEEAFDVLVELNDRYALDGRDPNSYAGIGWALGRHDRPWPERPIFGTVRCMTSASARRKLDLDSWIAEQSGPGGAAG